MWILRSAKALQEEVDKLLPARVQERVAPSESHDLKVLFDRLITDRSLVDCSRDLFFSGYYASSVLEAFKMVCVRVKKRSKLQLDGATLMRTAFSPNKPILFLNQHKSQSERDEQQGYMDVFAGAMTGIRNPRAHEPNYDDEPDRALEMLVVANHLLARLNKSKKSK